MDRPHLSHTCSLCLSSLPGLAVATFLAVYFRHAAPTSDGDFWYRCALTAFSPPFSLGNLQCLNHPLSLVSMFLLGLGAHIGSPPFVGVHLVQYALYITTLVALAALCRRVFPRITLLENAALTLVFAVTPAYVISFLYVSLDYITVPFCLLYVVALVSDKPALAGLAAVAMVFTKESGLLVYAATLPFVLLLCWRRACEGGFSFRFLTVLLPALCVALCLFWLRYSLKEPLGTCRGSESIVQFLLNPNLGRREVQGYLLDVSVLNFQWVLSICAVVSVGLFVFRSRRITLRDALPETHGLWLVVLFLLAWIYTITRCPIYNNPKYVINALPFFLIVVFWISHCALRRPLVRVAFLLVVATLFSVSMVRTVDPVSKLVFGTFEVNGRERLCLPNWGRRLGEGCGNDERFYNLEPYLP
jgi:hypothetical protein